jgi:hypothetical protein
VPVPSPSSLKADYRASDIAKRKQRILSWSRTNPATTTNHSHCRQLSGRRRWGASGDRDGRRKHVSVSRAKTLLPIYFHDSVRTRHGQTLIREKSGLLPVSSRSASSATLHSGLFLPQRDPESWRASRTRIRKPNLAEGAALARRKGFPQSSALRLCRPSLTLVLSASASLPLQGWEIPLPCALPPRLRQEAFGM